MKEFDTERMCRINGKQPTARDRWTAFHRLWRLSRGHGSDQDMAAMDCFRVLYKNWAWIRLLERGQPTLSRVHWPTFLRRSVLERERATRLYPQGNKEDWQKRDKKIALMCHETKGVEVTPEEVAGIRAKVIKLVRDRAECEGVRLPADDLKLLEWLSKGREGA